MQATRTHFITGFTLQGIPVPVTQADPSAKPPPDTKVGEKDAFLVSFPPGDPENPRNWSNLKKWTQLLLYLLPEFWAQVISSIFAPGEMEAAYAVGVSEVTLRAVQAIYLYGFAVGPVVVAPGSEDYGRKWILIFSVLVIGLCQIPCALAGSIALMLPFRFIAGFLAATTFNSVGVVGDLWPLEQQGWGVNSFALAAEGGAYLGAVIGSFIVQRIGWRWTFGASGLGIALIFLVLLCFLRETRGGVLLSRRAAKRRNDTGDGRFYAAHEHEVENKTVRTILTETVGRPVWMLFTEPIVIATALYDGINYAVIYCIILGFSVIYGDTYGFSIEQQNLPFLGVFLGAVIAFFCLPLQRMWERRAMRKSPTGELRPEERLVWLLTTPLFPISLFWLAWTAIPEVHWSSSVAAASVFGFVSHIIFVAISDCEYHSFPISALYPKAHRSCVVLIDIVQLHRPKLQRRGTDTTSCYQKYAASSIGAQSLLRELFSGSFTFFIISGYEHVGIPEFGTIVASFAVLVSIVPFGLYWLGPTLRLRSPFCVEQIKQQWEQRLEEKQREDDIHAFSDRASGIP